MSSFSASQSFGSSPRMPGGLATFVREVRALFFALIQPGKIIGEVERMRALQLEADHVEASNPARAAELRRQASRIGLR